MAPLMQEDHLSIHGYSCTICTHFLLLISELRTQPQKPRSLLIDFSNV